MNELNRAYLNGLKNEHKEVIRLLGNIKDRIQINDIRGVAGNMDLLKISLLAHIKSCNELFKTAQEKNLRTASSSVIIFSAAMKGVVYRTLEFFNKYLEKNAMLKKDATAKLTEEFPKDFQLLHEDLLKRIGNEDRILYCLYEKHCC